MRYQFRGSFVLGVALALFAGCSGAPTGPQASAALEFDACRPAGIPWPARCTTVDVPADPSQPSGPTLGLRVVILPARGRNPAPDPVLLLAGGPGQAASEAFAPVLEQWEAINETRDVVLVDQRGTGASAALDCEFPSSLQDVLDARFPTAELQACAARLRTAGWPVQTWAAVADLDRVRQALGYAQVNLVGGSYGTRVALAYMREHPDAVRLAVLDGAAPPDMAMPLSFARDAQAALDRVVDDCAADPACHAAFPAVRTQLEHLLVAPHATERQVTVRHPLTDEPVDLRLTPQGLAAGIRSLLYVPELTTLLPWTLAQTARGNFSPLVAQIHLFSSDLQKSMSMGMFLAVVCAEDVPFIADSEVMPATRDTFFGRNLVDQLREACAMIPRGSVPRQFRDPVAVSVPTLVLSGEFDPVTPPRWGEHVVRHLPQAHHVVVAGAGHGTLFHGCIPQRLQRVIETGRIDQDFSCAAEGKRSPFFVDFYGPPPT